MKKTLFALLLISLISSPSISANYLKSILSSKLTFESFEEAVDIAHKTQREKIHRSYCQWVNHNINIELDNFGKKIIPFAQAVLLPLKSKIIVIGDIHNSYKDFKSILDSVEPDDQTYFVTLGDYCGRLRDGAIQVLYTLLLLFIKRPDKTFLLPGNHDYQPFSSHEIWPLIRKLAINANREKYEAEYVFSKAIDLFHSLPQNLFIGKSCGTVEKYEFICCAHAGPIGPDPKDCFKTANLNPLLEKVCREKKEGVSYFCKLYGIPVHNWAIWSDYVAEIPKNYKQYFKYLGPLYPSYRGKNEIIRVIGQDFMEKDYFHKHQTNNFNVSGLIRAHGHLPRIQVLQEAITISNMPAQAQDILKNSKQKLDRESMELETGGEAWKNMFEQLSDHSWKPLEKDYVYKVNRSIFSCTSAPYLWTSNIEEPASYAILESGHSGWYLTPMVA